MAYTNSPLVNYTRISPNRTVGRNHKIDTITIHCVVGQCSVETLGNVFAPTSRRASSNYGIGYDGKIGMYCEEKDRSWCTSSSSNDNRAVTIEVASDTKSPYAVNAAAYKSLIKLVADICKRNGIKELKWKADKSLIGNIDKQNMTVHRWFASTSCPGDYLYSRMGQIAKDVNEKLGADSENSKVNNDQKKEEATSSIKSGDIVKIKSGSKYYNGKDIPDWVENKQWIVSSVSGDRVVLGKSVDGKNTINSPIKSTCLTVAKQNSGETFNSYKVKVEIPNLNIRKGPGTNYATVGKFTGVGVFTIVDESKGQGSSKWGLLRSYKEGRNGWISLDHAKRI